MAPLRFVWQGRTTLNFWIYMRIQLWFWHDFFFKKFITLQETINSKDCFHICKCHMVTYNYWMLRPFGTTAARSSYALCLKSPWYAITPVQFDVEKEKRKSEQFTSDCESLESSAVEHIPGSGYLQVDRISDSENEQPSPCDSTSSIPVCCVLIYTFTNRYFLLLKNTCSSLSLLYSLHLY